MSSLRIILYIAISISLLSSCSNSPKKDTQKLQIIATIYPYQLITQQITGDKAIVTTFIPGNASPHTYSPTPRDMQKMHDADIVIANGLNLEANMMAYFKELGSKVVFASDFIPIKELTPDLEEKDSYNPHVWTEPSFILQIAQGIEGKLEAMDPQNKAIYQKNLEQLKLDLTNADTQIQAQRKLYGKLGIVTFHDSYKYFNDKYDIELIGTVESSPGKEPSPRELMELGTRIKQFNVHAIFIEPEFNPKSAEVIASEYKLSVLKYDPIGTTMQVGTISEFLLKNWEFFKQGF